MTTTMKLMRKTETTKETTMIIVIRPIDSMRAAISKSKENIKDQRNYNIIKEVLVSMFDKTSKETILEWRGKI